MKLLNKLICISVLIVILFAFINPIIVYAVETNEYRGTNRCFERKKLG